MDIFFVLPLSFETNTRHFYLEILHRSLHRTTLMTSNSRLPMLYSFKDRHRLSCQTRSNAFLKSMQLWNYDYLAFWCSKSFSINTLKLNIYSVIWILPVPLPIVLWFWQSRTLPVFGRGIMSNCVQSSGHCPLASPDFVIYKALMTPSPPCLRISA